MRWWFRLLLLRERLNFDLLRSYLGIRLFVVLFWHNHLILFLVCCVCVFGVLRTGVRWAVCDDSGRAALCCAQACWCQHVKSLILVSRVRESDGENGGDEGRGTSHHFPYSKSSRIGVCTTKAHTTNGLFNTAEKSNLCSLRGNIQWISQRCVCQWS